MITIHKQSLTVFVIAMLNLTACGDDDAANDAGTGTDTDTDTDSDTDTDTDMDIDTDADTDTDSDVDNDTDTDTDSDTTSDSDTESGTESDTGLDLHESCEESEQCGNEYICCYTDEDFDTDSTGVSGSVCAEFGECCQCFYEGGCDHCSETEICEDDPSYPGEELCQTGSCESGCRTTESCSDDEICCASDISECAHCSGTCQTSEGGKCLDGDECLTD